MSQSPTSANDKDGLSAYRTAWQATQNLLRQGRSYSGHERNCAFLNCRGRPFANVSAISGLDFADDGRAVGLVDWDQDGDLDMWIANRTAPRLRMMCNRTIDGGKSTDDSQFVALRLQGTTSNRDAIGARVSVHLLGKNISEQMYSIRSEAPSPDLTTVVQTLRAGDGFLSQSSKWLHFGLGEAKSIKEVTVRWPSGTQERFADIQPGNRYLLVEGAERAIPLPAAGGTVPKSGGMEAADALPTTGLRTFFSNRVPMPLLQYEPLSSLGRQPISTRGGPLLLMIWASWCTPCLQELQAIGEEEATIKNLPLRVLALSVDGVDQTQPTNSSHARAAIDKLKFPFSSGMATRELLDKLGVVEGLVLNHQLPISVPTSYLFDAQGDLAAIYRGAVDPAQLETDLRNLETPLERRRDLAVPMPGHWLSPPRQLLMRAVARAFQQQGYDDDFKHYSLLDTQFLRKLHASAATEAQRVKLATQFANAYFDLGMAQSTAGDGIESLEYFRRAIEVQPDHVGALINLGALLARARQFGPALEYLSRAVSHEPKSIAARTNLAAALSAEGRFSEALPHYRAILAIEPDHATTLAHFARALLELNQPEEAVPQLRRALVLNPHDVPAGIALAWIGATAADDRLRNGEEALQLATGLNARFKGRHVIVLDVLAAAQAETGDFSAAVTSLQKGLEQVGDTQPDLRKMLLARLQQFQAKQAHRDADSRYP